MHTAHQSVLGAHAIVRTAGILYFTVQASLSTNDCAACYMLQTIVLPDTLGGCAWFGLAALSLHCSLFEEGLKTLGDSFCLPAFTAGQAGLFNDQ